MADQVVTRKEYLRKNREMIARVTEGFKVCPVCRTRVAVDEAGTVKTHGSAFPTFTVCKGVGMKGQG